MLQTVYSGPSPGIIFFWRALSCLIRAQWGQHLIAKCYWCQWYTVYTVDTACVLLMLSTCRSTISVAVCVCGWEAGSRWSGWSMCVNVLSCRNRINHTHTHTPSHTLNQNDMVSGLGHWTSFANSAKSSVLVSCPLMSYAKNDIITSHT